jgi:hypothetical protein
VTNIEYLLAAAPSARKSLDLNAPVKLDDIRDCPRIDLQAANGSYAVPRSRMGLSPLCAAHSPRSV